MSGKIGKLMGIGVVLVLTLGTVGAVLAQGPPPPTGDGTGPSFGGRRGRPFARMFCGRRPQMLARGLGMDLEDVQAALGNTVSELAAAQGMTVEEVADNILAPAIERIQQAVEDGRLTQDRADEMIAQMKSRLVEGLENGTWFSWGSRKSVRRHGADPAVPAEALGMTEDELRAALTGGKTIAEVAEEQGVALDDLVDTLIAPAAERIRQQVENGTLTQEEADAHLEEMRAHVREMLEGSARPPARPGFPGRRSPSPHPGRPGGYRPWPH